MRETSLEARRAGGRQTPSPSQESEGATPEQGKYGWREGAEPLGGRISMIGGLEEAVPKMTAMLGGLKEPGQ